MYTLSYQYIFLKILAQIMKSTFVTFNYGVKTSLNYNEYCSFFENKGDERLTVQQLCAILK